MKMIINIIDGPAQSSAMDLKILTIVNGILLVSTLIGIQRLIFIILDLWFRGGVELSRVFSF